MWAAGAGTCGMGGVAGAGARASVSTLPMAGAGSEVPPTAGVPGSPGLTSLLSQPFNKLAVSFKVIDKGKDTNFFVSKSLLSSTATFRGGKGAN